MNKTKITIFLLSFLALNILPLPALAQTKLTPQCQELLNQFNQAKVDGKMVGANVAALLPKYCTEGDLFKKVSNYVYVSVGVIAVIAYIYGGYMYMVSGANENSKKIGKEVLLYTTFGVLVVLTAVVLVNIVARLITGLS